MSKFVTAASRLLLTLVVLSQFLFTLPTSARSIAAPAIAGDELWGSYLTGTNGSVYAVVASGSDIYIGGDFTLAGSTPVHNIAHWSHSSHRWYALGEGVNSRVTALTVYGTHLYAGGNFTTAGGQATAYLAQWDTLTETWSPVGSGTMTFSGIFSPSVNALAIYGSGNVIVAGKFETVGGVTARNIAMWNGSNWAALGSGLGDGSSNQEVSSLAVSGTDVYAGGDFTTYHCVAHWNGSTWQGLGSGTLDSFYPTVDTVAVSGGNVYIGGAFDKVADGFGSLSVNRIARWSIGGSRWYTLGSGLDAGIYTLAVSAGGTLYAGGQFGSSGGTLTTSHLASWDGSTWSQVTDASLGQGTDGNVNALFLNGTALYAGGAFNSAGSSKVGGIGRYDTTNGSWTGLGSSVDGSITAMAVSGTNVYLGGLFTSANGLATPGIAHLQTANGTWSILGGGGLAGCTGLLCSPSIQAILVTESDVYVTGNFGSVGGVAANGVARWNKSDLTWHALGTGLGCSSFLCAFYGSALAFNPASGQLFVGGNFTSAGGVAAANLAKWSLGGGWSTVNSPGAVNPNGTVYALAWSGTHLYVGGSFSTPAAYFFALNFSSVSAVGGAAPNSMVQALAVDSSYIYVGGSFTNLSTNGRVARIANTNIPASATWLNLGSGLDGTVTSLAVYGGQLAAGGSFQNSGINGVNHIALWNGFAWTNLGSGVNAPVDAVALDNNFVYAGGDFTTVGAGVASSPFNTWGSWHNYLPIAVRQ